MGKEVSIMAKVERSITINDPVEKVFAYMRDPMSYLEWLSGMIMFAMAKLLNVERRKFLKGIKQ